MPLFLDTRTILPAFEFAIIGSTVQVLQIVEMLEKRISLPSLLCERPPAFLNFYNMQDKTLFKIIFTGE